MFHRLFFGFCRTGGGAHVQQPLGQGADGVEIHGVVGAGAAQLHNHEPGVVHISDVPGHRAQVQPQLLGKLSGGHRLFPHGVHHFHPGGAPQQAHGGVLPILQLGHGNARLGLDVDANAEAGQISFLIYQSGGEIWEEEEEGGGGAVQGVVGLNQHISLQEPR